MVSSVANEISWARWILVERAPQLPRGVEGWRVLSAKVFKGTYSGRPASGDQETNNRSLGLSDH